MAAGLGFEPSDTSLNLNSISLSVKVTEMELFMRDRIYVGVELLATAIRTRGGV